jgi:nucleotide-binding universal stress UspA family protein
MNLELRTIVVATDFGTAADYALQYAGGLASRFGASLHLLHVVETPLPAAAWSEAYALDLPAMREQLESDSGRRLQDIAMRLSPLEVTTEVRCGRAPQAIVEAAREREADMVVLGTHGHGVVAHLLLGSVAERVIRWAPCPVLTVRLPGTASAQLDPPETVSTSAAGGRRR